MVVLIEPPPYSVFLIIAYTVCVKKYVILGVGLSSIVNKETSMTYRKSHARYDEFTEQFLKVLHRHWDDILLFVKRQSSRVASLLQLATPCSVKRTNGTWYVQVLVKRETPTTRLRSPRDNEVVSQAIRLWAHTVAQLTLPCVTVKFIS